MTPNPGSDQAVKIGCTCPVSDNARGRGFTVKGATQFWYDAACPVHGNADSPMQARSAAPPPDVSEKVPGSIPEQL